jgi:Fic family protein
MEFMSKKTSDIKADILAANDKGETISLMEPMLVSTHSRHYPKLVDLAVELVAKATGFQRSLPVGIRNSLADLVRAMNCYYSNLIEGHNTHPIDIERALQGDYSKDIKKRNLQLEAKAHIAVQQWIDAGNIKNRAATKDALLDIHRRFGELLPEDLLCVEIPKTHKKIKMIPGTFRLQEVVVGNHLAISPGAIPRFLERFESVYQNLSKAEMIIGLAAAHHRFLWIHPFLDGNGRVARLMSHAMLLDILDTNGIWSIARGLARNAEIYKDHLANCDLNRRNDLDGRGNLSEEALANFTQFFLETCLDQIEFMESLMQADRLRTRILLWAEEEIRLGNLPAKSTQILEIILYRGELLRNEVGGLLEVSDRQARRIVASLVEKGVLVSATPKSSLHLVFPATLAGPWMPGLFPEQA